jgi:hypothetical protein
MAGENSTADVDWATHELVMKSGGLEIEIESHHAFTGLGEKPRGIRKKHGTPDAALIGIECYSLHDL